MKRAIILSALLIAAQSPAPPIFKIGDAVISRDNIIDARAQPKLGGGVTMVLTLDAVTGVMVSAEMGSSTTATVDGAPLCAQGAFQVSPESVVTLDCFAGRTIESVEALAKHLSGKDPLPDSLDDQP